MGEGSSAQLLLSLAETDQERRLSEYASRDKEKQRAATIAYARSKGVPPREEPVREWLRRLKSETPCADCGQTYPYYVMHFDHLPGHVKLFELSRSKNRRRQEVEVEVAKCEIVCANCHQIRTYERVRLQPRPAQQSKPPRIKTCARCKQLYSGPYVGHASDRLHMLSLKTNLRPMPVERYCEMCGSILGQRRRKWCSDACFPPREHQSVAMASCHPDRKAHARGMCRPCYSSDRQRRLHPIQTLVCARIECGRLFRRVRFGPRRYCSDTCRKQDERQSSRPDPRHCAKCLNPMAPQTRSDICRSCRLANGRVRILECFICGSKSEYRKCGRLPRFCALCRKGEFQGREAA